MRKALIFLLLLLYQISKEKKILKKNLQEIITETPEETLERLKNNMDELSKTKITLDNLLTKKQSSAQSIIQDVSNEIGIDNDEEQEKLKN